MSDVPRPQDSVEQRLGLVARGVQRMADAFGSLEQRLDDLAAADQVQALSDRTDEYRVRTHAEVVELTDRLEKLESEQQRALDLLRAVGLSIDASTSVRASTASVDISGPMDRLIEAVLGLRDDLVVAVGELRAETTAAIERGVTDAVRDATPALPPAPAAAVDDGRLAAIENVIASLRDELAIDRLETSLRDMAEDTSGLR